MHFKSADPPTSNKEESSYPSTTFAVLADNHYYDRELGISGRAFNRALERNGDIKMLQYSQEVLREALEEAVSLPVDFLLICGDLTKDGEAISHSLLAETLGRMQKKGLKTFVINGNHDIQNPRAACFRGTKRERVETVSAADFVRIYSEFGYGAALDRDPVSLSYVAEPVPGLWLLAVDTCLWQEGFREEGRIQARTLEWVEKVLLEARRRKKALLGMMHHGLLEHYRGNRKFYGNYLIHDNLEVSKRFARGGLKIVFTGHFHSQDVALLRLKGEDAFVYDVETGSLVTYPCPYRLVTIDSSQKMHVSSKRVTATVSHPHDFPAFAHEYCRGLAEKLVVQRLRRWGVSSRDSRLLAPQVVAAFQAHGTGNEEKPSRVLDLEGVGLWGRFVVLRKKPLLGALWEQAPPPDNRLTIDLKTGAYCSLREVT